MSVWDKIEEAMQNRPVSVKLTPRQAFVVREALNDWSNEVLESSSAWDALRLMTEWDWPWKKKGGDPEQLRSPLTGDGQKAIKGLDPKEVEVIRQIVPNAKARQGDTGQVMAMPPKEWQRIQAQIEKQADYYDRMLGNEITAATLSKKIGDQVALETGVRQGPSKLLSPDMSGKPSDPTDVQRGAERYGNVPSSQISPGPSYAKQPSQQAPDEFDIDPQEPVDEPGVAPAGSARPKRVRKPRSKKAATAAAPLAAPAEPAPETPASRRARVAKQDMEMMGAKNPEDVKRMTRSGKARVK